jgi:ribosome maturation factor RimP
VQFRREGHGWVLRLLIDRKDGVSHDDCSRVSRETSDFLDVEDIIEHQYHLEVSSPGAERALRTLEECQRFINEKVRVKLNGDLDGQKVFVGELTIIDGDCLTLVTEEAKEYNFFWNDIKKARLTL